MLSVLFLYRFFRDFNRWRSLSSNATVLLISVREMSPTRSEHRTMMPGTSRQCVGAGSSTFSRCRVFPGTEASAHHCPLTWRKPLQRGTLEVGLESGWREAPSRPFGAYPARSRFQPTETEASSARTGLRSRRAVAKRPCSCQANGKVHFLNRQDAKAAKKSCFRTGTNRNPCFANLALLVSLTVFPWPDLALSYYEPTYSVGVLVAEPSSLSPLPSASLSPLPSSVVDGAGSVADSVSAASPQPERPSEQRLSEKATTAEYVIVRFISFLAWERNIRAVEADLIKK